MVEALIYDSEIDNTGVPKDNTKPCKIFLTSPNAAKFLSENIPPSGDGNTSADSREALLPMDSIPIAISKVDGTSLAEPLAIRGLNSKNAEEASITQATQPPQQPVYSPYNPQGMVYQPQQPQQQVYQPMFQPPAQPLQGYMTAPQPMQSYLPPQQPVVYNQYRVSPTKQTFPPAATAAAQRNWSAHAKPAPVTPATLYRPVGPQPTYLPPQPQMYSPVAAPAPAYMQPMGAQPQPIYHQPSMVGYQPQYGMS